MQHKNEKEVRLDFLFVHKGNLKKHCIHNSKLMGCMLHFVMEILIPNIDFFFTQ